MICCEKMAFNKMVGALFFCLYFGMSSSFTSEGNLDLAELQSVQYSLEILDTPIEDTTEDTKDKSVSPTMTMVNKDGQKYRCSLPQIPATESDAENKNEEKDTDIAKLLGPLEEGPCMYKTKDWWTYEICYNSAVKQYHMENEKPIGAVMVLGVHSPALDSWGQSNKTYQPQWYTNGSKCDLTGRPRQTELRFVCNEAATQELVGDIFEPQSCEYTIVIHTSKLCGVPWLKPVADPTPLPVVCNPMLSQAQIDKYKLYQERKKVAEKERQAKKALELASQMGAKQVGLGKPGADNSLAGLLSSIGENVADSLVTEINSLIDKAIAGDGGIKVVDLRGKEEDKKTKEIVNEGDEKESTLKHEESASTDSKWDLIHHKHQPVSDPELQELITERNVIWRKIHEAKKSVKKYTTQLHDKDTFLKNEKTEPVESKEIIENALAKARETVIDLEVNAKEFSHKIVSMQNKIIKSEGKLWNRKLSILEDMMKKGSADFTIILTEMAKDFKKHTNERLIRINDYFTVAKKFADQGDLNVERFEKLRQFMQFADGELLNILEDQDIEAMNQEIFDNEIKKLSNENIEKAAKFRDVVKEDVREKFSDILKEVSEDLELPEGDVDKDEAMAAMSKTLDQLMNKLAGAGDKIHKVQKQVANLKQVSEDKDAKDEIVNLKRDNKKSVKKELREDRADMKQDDDNNEDDEMDIKFTINQLEEAEAEVENLENEFMQLSNNPQLNEETGNEVTNEKVNTDLENVKVSLTNLSPGGESLDEEQTNKIVKKLEGTIRDKLTKLGLDTGGRPIEIKLITTQLPEGLEEGMGGEGEDVQVQGMFFNMMTGNIQGYEDINSQRKVENNYKFSWNEGMVEDIEKKIDEFTEEDSETVKVDENKIEPEEIVTTYDPSPFDIFEGGDERQRPSSFTTEINQSEEEEMSAEEEIDQERDEL